MTELEKEAVQKIVGAKGAMEKVIARNNELENVIKKLLKLHQESNAAISKDASIYSNYSGVKGGWVNDKKYVSASSFFQQAKVLASEHLDL